MRKLFIVVVSLTVLILAWTPVQASAAAGLTFTVSSNADVSRGETVSVPITVSNNTGFMAVGFAVTYDPNVLEIIGFIAPMGDMPLNTQTEMTATPGNQWLSLINTNFADWSGNGTVVNIFFNVKSTAPAGASPIFLAFTSTPDGAPVSISGDIFSEATTVSGSVNVARDVNSRDINNNGTDNSSSRVVNDNSDDPGNESGSSSNSDPRSDSGLIEPVIDDGGFIGAPYTEDRNGSEVARTTTSRSGETNSGSDFGRPPRTGVPDMTGQVAIVCVLLASSVALAAYILRRKIFKA